MFEELEAKNVELERFNYTVSHDLKSPLVTIKGFLGLLARDAAAGDTERVRHDVGRIGQAADTMRQLLEDLRVDGARGVTGCGAARAAMAKNLC